MYHACDTHLHISDWLLLTVLISYLLTVLTGNLLSWQWYKLMVVEEEQDIWRLMDTGKEPDFIYLMTTVHVDGCSSIRLCPVSKSTVTPLPPTVCMPLGIESCVLSTHCDSWEEYVIRKDPCGYRKVTVCYLNFIQNILYADILSSSSYSTVHLWCHDVNPYKCLSKCI